MSSKTKFLLSGSKDIEANLFFFPSLYAKLADRKVREKAIQTPLLTNLPGVSKDVIHKFERLGINDVHDFSEFISDQSLVNEALRSIPMDELIDVKHQVSQYFSNVKEPIIKSNFQFIKNDTKSIIMTILKNGPSYSLNFCFDKLLFTFQSPEFSNLLIEFLKIYQKLEKPTLYFYSNLDIDQNVLPPNSLIFLNHDKISSVISEIKNSTFPKSVSDDIENFPITFISYISYLLNIETSPKEPSEIKVLV